MNNILKKKGKLKENIEIQKMQPRNLHFSEPLSVKGNNIREHIIIDREISRPGLKKIFWAEDHL